MVLNTMVEAPADKTEPLLKSAPGAAPASIEAGKGIEVKSEASLCSKVTATLLGILNRPTCASILGVVVGATPLRMLLVEKV